MSELTTFSYRADAEVSQRRVALLAGVGALLASAASGVATAAGGTLRGMREHYERRVAELSVQGETDARLRALDEIPLLRAAVLKAAADQGVCTDDPIALKHAGPAILAGLDGQRVAPLLAQGMTRLRVAQAGVLKESFAAALADMGYELRQPRRVQRNTVSLRADAADGTAVTVQIDPRSEQLSVDLSGFRPGVCLQARERLVAGLRRRGIHLEALAATRHDNAAGSCLTGQVQALLVEDSADNTTTTLHPRIPTTRSRT